MLSFSLPEFRRLILATNETSQYLTRECYMTQSFLAIVFLRNFGRAGRIGGYPDNWWDLYCVALQGFTPIHIQRRFHVHPLVRIVDDRLPIDQIMG